MGVPGIYVWDGPGNEPVLLGAGTEPVAPDPTRVQISEVSFTSASGTPTPDVNERDTLLPAYGDYNPAVPFAGLPGDGMPPGCRRDKTLTPFSGPFTVTRNNQVVEDLEIFGPVNCGTFTGTIIRNCRVWGFANVPANWGVLRSSIYGSGDNLRGAVIEDCELPFWGNFWTQGVRGGNYTMRRCDVGGQDPIGLTSALGNVSILGCWIHNGTFGEWDASQIAAADGGDNSHPSGGSMYSHVDGVQFHRGRMYRIVGNFIGGVRNPWDHHLGKTVEINQGDDCYNAAFMIKQEVSNSEANLLDDVIIEKNWLMGGFSTINITTPGASASGPKNWMVPAPATTWTNPTTGAVVQIAERKGVIIRNNIFPRSTWDQLLATRYLNAANGGGLMDPTGAGQTYILRDDNVGVFQNNIHEDDGAFVTITRGGNYL